MNGNTIDLIYLDPPFNSDEVYNKPHKKDEDIGSAQDIVFTDIWEWDAAAIQRTQKMIGAVGHPASKLMESLSILIPQSKMLSYISYMAERLAVLKDFLKSTGSIYLHCDPYANYYLRLLMDAIFGQENFRNEITWKRCSSHALVKKGFDNIADTILFYARDAAKMKFNKAFAPADDDLKRFPHIEAETGRRYQHCSLENASNKSSAGQPRRFIDRTIVSKIGWKWTQETLDARLAKNPYLIYWTKNGRPRYKIYADGYPGPVVGTIWTDIPYLASGDKERLGYPTQKPVALLERIIRASSNEGDLVFDPFCGCGTALEAAALLGRRFVGIDISLFAARGVSRERLVKNGIPCAIEGIPKDLRQAEELAKRDKHKFEWWASESMIPGGIISNKKKGADSGIDGRGRLLNKTTTKRNLVIVQVKGGKPTLSQVRDFAQVIKREKAAAGVFITLRESDWSRPMREEANSCGQFRIPGVAEEYPVLQHWAVEEILVGKRFHTPGVADKASPDPVLPMG